MNINEIISEFNKAKEEKNDAEKRYQKYKALIEQYAKGQKAFSTDEYTVIIQARKQTRIDTETLYRDFPDFKDVYGKENYYNIITATEKAIEKTA